MSERDPSPFIRVPNRLRTTPRIFQQTFRVNLCYFPTAAKGDFPILLLTRWRDGYFPPDSVFPLFVACTFHSGLCAVEYRLVVGNRHRPKRGSRRGSDGDRHTDDYRTVPADREHRSRIVRIPEPRRRNVHAVGRKGGVQEAVAFQHRDRHFDQVSSGPDARCRRRGRDSDGHRRSTGAAIRVERDRHEFCAQALQGRSDLRRRTSQPRGVHRTAARCRQRRGGRGRHFGRRAPVEGDPDRWRECDQPRIRRRGVQRSAVGRGAGRIQAHQRHLRRGVRAHRRRDRIVRHGLRRQPVPRKCLRLPHLERAERERLGQQCAQRQETVLSRQRLRIRARRPGLGAAALRRQGPDLLLLRPREFPPHGLIFQVSQRADRQAAPGRFLRTASASHLRPDDRRAFRRQHHPADPVQHRQQEHPGRRSAA